ncbi:MAG: hypothetical protein LBJ47_09845 [Tannerella sp.]|jgi:hypothetical protein|nr:hypothetical protein [Tannerella sp.]
MQAFRIDERDACSQLSIGNALIRANFGTDPATLTPVEWAQQMQEALWYERYKLRSQAELLAALFGNKKH